MNRAFIASLSGVVHAASGQRAICADPFNGSTDSGGKCSDWASVGTGETLNASFAIDLPGGVQRVVIWMLDE